MALIKLPTELLEIIITHVLPEGFESAALSCTRIYAICVPFIECHNILRSRFHTFFYYLKGKYPSSHMLTAADLIRRIAVEPIVAGYIQHAYLGCDSAFGCGIISGSNDADVNAGITRLLPESTYLKQAGLTWDDYFDEIAESQRIGYYSQHAAAFLLTLLPNVRTLTLPRYWRPTNSTDKLMAAVVHKSKQPYSLTARLSLSKVARFKACTPDAPLGRWHSGVDLASASSFLALPRLRFFVLEGFVGRAHKVKSKILRDPQHRLGETLESAVFVTCCLDAIDIAELLKDTINLRRLRYLHSMRMTRGPEVWDICEFVTAIGRQVGSHVVTLSLEIHKTSGIVVPGKVSMRDFRCLKQLAIPLDLPACSITAAAAHEVDSEALFVGNLVPPSVSLLSLTSPRKGSHIKVLDIMFRDFTAKKAAIPTALKTIQFHCPDGVSRPYKHYLDRLFPPIREADVTVRIDQYRDIAFHDWN